MLQEWSSRFSIGHLKVLVFPLLVMFGWSSAYELSVANTVCCIISKQIERGINWSIPRPSKKTFKRLSWKSFASFQTKFIMLPAFRGHTRYCHVLLYALNFNKRALFWHLVWYLRSLYSYLKFSFICYEYFSISIKSILCNIHCQWLRRVIFKKF